MNFAYKQNKTKYCNKNAINVQQNATKGGGARALTSEVQRLAILFFRNKIISSSGPTGNSTIHLHFIEMNLLFPDRPQLLLTINFTKIALVQIQTESIDSVESVSDRGFSTNL